MGIYDDVKIVAASVAESGPVGTMALALLGADVIHIDRTKDKPGFRAASYIHRMLSKRVITLDTSKDEGKEILWKLIADADVFFENYAPGGYNRMGFSYEEVRKRNPNIIYVSLHGFTHGSKWEKGLTFDPVSCCSGGSTFLGGVEDGGAMLCGINIADSGSGIHLAMAVSAALLRRKLTGKGEFIEFSMQEAVTSQCRRAFPEYYATGNVRRAGNSYRGIEPTAPCNMYPCKRSDGPEDGDYIKISCSNDPESEDFRNLCKAIQREDLLDDPDYATPALRYKNRNKLDAEIRKWTMEHEKLDAMRILSKEYHVPAAACMSVKELSNDEYLKTTILRDVGEKRCSGYCIPLIPLKMSECEFNIFSPVIQGYCNNEVYSALGYTPEQLKELEEKEVIKNHPI